MTTQTSDVILERMKSLHPKVMDLTLERVWQLLQALDNPQDKMPPVIHVAGTNGKGSTLAMIRAGVEGAGKTAHAYTSPHLARFHERIRVAGQLIEESDLTAVLDECYLANGGDPITYFEITTCAGLLAFSRIAADFTLLEVGLGGRLDATNVCPAPCLTVITPVSIDHEQYLGDTIAKIAFEKVMTDGLMKVRAYLWEHIHTSKGVMYCDTDSIICEEFVGKVGAELGEWEIEAAVRDGVLDVEL